MSALESFTAVVDASSYMTLATSDADGRPWPTPVWFAHEGYREFFWISKPGARHSLNIAARPEVGVVIFDSTVAPMVGGGIYFDATATELTDPAERERGIEIYTRREVADGLDHLLTVDDVTGDARLRLYRAVAGERYVLDAHDERVAV
jgi:nitroimidazol reductase NimA-like FMN-containing flavoprotein (pyridoxamine 5'-phosphate oxidase superfamily)